MKPVVGSICVLKLSCLENPVGAMGVVYYVYQRGKDDEGVQIIFENGRYDGFSPEDQELIVEWIGVVDPQVAKYKFFSAMRLTQDAQRGLFRDAFERHRRIATERCPGCQKTGLQMAATTSDPEGVRRDRSCPHCGARVGSRKHGLVLLDDPPSTKFEMLDVNPKFGVQIEIRHDRKVVWVHVDGVTVIRINNPPKIEVMGE